MNMNKFHIYLRYAAVFLIVMFILQFIFRHRAIVILGLNLVMLAFEILIFWKFVKWIDE